MMALVLLGQSQSLVGIYPNIPITELWLDPNYGLTSALPARPPFRLSSNANYDGKSRKIMQQYDMQE